MTGSLEAGDFVLPTGTVAFLLTDVEASTRLWEAEPDAMAAAMTRHAEIVDAAVSAHGGVCPPAQGEGDSVVAAFARASDAVLAALDAQRALVAERWPTTHPLRVRMAVHAGEARTAVDGNYAGQAIIRTARLRAIAHGGQVLVSAPARDLTVDHLGDQIRLTDLGEHRLRDLARPERVYELAGPGLLEGFEPLRSLDTHPNNLPLQLSTFIGRVDEIATVVGLMRDNRLVTITGAGGSGKTRLALQVAAEVIERTADGTWWVELADVRDADLVTATIATTLGTKGEVGVGAADALAKVLANRDMLVVVDNCEHVIDVVAATVDRLLRGCPNVRVLATSREPLEVAGEVAWRIPPLGLPEPPATPLPVSALPQSDSVRLFLDRAQRVRPNFHLTDDNAPVVAGICQRLDGIPLAIELAAARCRSLAIEQIADGLDDAFQLLTGGGRATVARQATLDASLTWSHNLLAPEEQTVLRRLAVFNGGCTLDDAEAVVADESVARSAVLDVLDRLVAQSLVQLDDEALVPRYRLLEIVRQYASHCLEDAGETDLLRRRHAEHFLARMKALVPEPGSAHDVRVQRWMASEFDNLLAALDIFAAAACWEDYAVLAIPVAAVCWLIAPATGLAVVDRCLDDGNLTEPGAVGLARMTRSSQRFMVGDLEGGFVDSVAALTVAEEHGDRFVRGWAKMGFALGVGQFRSEDSDALFEEALADARDSGSLWLEALVQQQWAQVVGVYRGETERAEAMQTEADQAWAALGYPTTVAGNADVIAGVVAWHLGDFDTAERRITQADEAIAALDEFGVNVARMARTTLVGRTAIFARSLLATSRGERHPLVDSLTAAIDLAESEALPASDYVLSAAALLDRLAQDDPAGALDRYRRCTAIVFDTPAIPIHVYGGTAHLALGDVAKARTLAEQARASAEHGGFLFAGAEALLLLGWVHMAERDTAAAIDTAHVALARAVEQRYRLIIIRVLELLATIAAADDDPYETVRLAGAIGRARDERGFRMRLVGLNDQFDRAVAVAREALGEEGFETAAAQGAQLDLDAAVDYVMRTRGERKRPTLGWASLTPTEGQVVAAVAVGLSNPQIAERLLMSRETVKTHLSHIFGKVGAANRAELAAMAATHAATVANGRGDQRPS